MKKIHDEPSVVSVTYKNVGARCYLNFLAIFAYLSFLKLEIDSPNLKEFTLMVDIIMFLAEFIIFIVIF